MGLASSPLFSAPILLRRQLNHHHPHLFSTFASPQLPFSCAGTGLVSRGSMAKGQTKGINDELAKLKKESAKWKTAHTELQTVKLELEGARRQVVSLEFQLTGEQQKLEEAKKACAVAVERHEKAMTNNEDLVRQRDDADAKVEALQKEVEDERARAVEQKESLLKELEAERGRVAMERETLQKQFDAERGRLIAEGEALKRELEAEREKAAADKEALMRELGEERAKAASERAAYPDLCIAAVEQLPDFQMAIDAVVASSLAREETGGAGPSKTTAKGRTESEVIAGFQQSDFYKHEMSEYWDSGWKMFKRRAEELFPELDFSGVTIGEDDVAQTPLDEGVKEEDLASSEEGE